MSRDDLLHFLRSQRYGVQTSVADSGPPQAAVVGFAVTDTLEIVFDSLDTSRKIRNLRRNQLTSFVIGGLTPGDEWTIQYEGVADEPEGSELEQMKELYFTVFPDGRGRLAWPGIVYTRVRPTWIRYSDFRKSPPEILHFVGNVMGK